MYGPVEVPSVEYIIIGTDPQRVIFALVGRDKGGIMHSANSSESS